MSVANGLKLFKNDARCLGRQARFCKTFCLPFHHLRHISSLRQPFRKRSRNRADYTSFFQPRRDRFITKQSKDPSDLEETISGQNTKTTYKKRRVDDNWQPNSNRQIQHQHEPNRTGAKTNKRGAPPQPNKKWGNNNRK